MARIELPCILLYLSIGQTYAICEGGGNTTVLFGVFHGLFVSLLSRWGESFLTTRIALGVPASTCVRPLGFPWLSSFVYADKPQTLDHLEDNIRRVIADIRSQMLEKVIESWTSRLDYIRASRGSPMPEIIFKM
ncbi:hypothetical protein TNCV_2447331 [Trichonephila clavipes]|uniref:Uncharacterized protein n=1 Tax=Trichonephila clavipes TaxID=2585209 RepID=A0A8X6SET6_TRICX|nr:hypothetical protein TNCV_2447331 [Trichonephila clavipes]